MSTIDIAKKYQTRDGREVRIYAVDGGAASPVHGAIRDGNAWVLCQWREDGENFSRTNADLVPVEGRGDDLYQDAMAGSIYAAIAWMRHPQVCTMPKEIIGLIELEINARNDAIEALKKENEALKKRGRFAARLQTELRESHKSEVAMLRTVMTLSHLDRETFICGQKESTE